MKGYLKPNLGKASGELKKEYKSVYCGLCHALKKNYGYIGVACLSYEMVFFLLIAISMETSREEPKIYHGQCTVSCLVPVSYIDYLQSQVMTTALLSILISYREALDNYEDSSSPFWRIINKLLHSKVPAAASYTNEAIGYINEKIDKYYEIEKNHPNRVADLIDACSDITGCIGIMLLPEDSDKIELTYNLSSLIGKWIYLVDACDDYMDDIKKKNYNPLLYLDDNTSIESIIRETEKSILQAADALPSGCYKELIKYILMYSLPETSNSAIKKYSNSLKDTGLSAH